MSYNVGDTVTLDGIESVIIYKADAEQEWGQYIVTDKNHDLSYYISGDDYVNSNNYNTSPGTFGYEWGGYETSTGITSREIGGGLSNTNSLIDMNLQPNTSGWKVVWDMIQQFRSAYSDKWFVPTFNELLEVYNQRSYLSNLSTSTCPYYWTSTERSSFTAYNIEFETGGQYIPAKFIHSSRARLCRYTTDEELSTPKVGDTFTLNGIESVIVYDAGSEQDWGRYILADKNHDLCYYIDGDDYIGSSDYEIFPGTFGYEWGGNGISTGITSQEIGDGLSNTNSLIALNLQPDTEGWRVVWDMVEQFRSTHSDEWFVPTVQELWQVYNQRNYLNNLSTTSVGSINPYYWSSSEYSDITATLIRFNTENDYNIAKSLHSGRTRLCRYASLELLLTRKNVEITCSTDSSQIYYTINNTDPNETSNLYSSQFEIVGVDYVRARAYRDGWIPSDSAVYDVANGTTTTLQNVSTLNVDGNYTYSSNKTRKEV